MFSKLDLASLSLRVPDKGEKNITSIKECLTYILYFFNIKILKKKINIHNEEGGICKFNYSVEISKN